MKKEGARTRLGRKTARRNGEMKRGELGHKAIKSTNNQCFFSRLSILGQSYANLILISDISQPTIVASAHRWRAARAQLFLIR